MTHLLQPLYATAAGSAPAADAPVISPSTAVLILLVAVVAVLARTVLGMRRDLAGLRERLTAPAAAPTAAPGAAAPAQAAHVAVLPAAPSGAPASDAQVFAAIAAAVHLALGRPGRLVEIRDVVMLGTSSPWSIEGRRQIHGSHTFR
jgi:hypothetical protein